MPCVKARKPRAVDRLARAIRDGIGSRWLTGSTLCSGLLSFGACSTAYTHGLVAEPATEGVARLMCDDECPVITRIDGEAGPHTFDRPRGDAEEALGVSGAVACFNPWGVPFSITLNAGRHTFEAYWYKRSGDYVQWGKLAVSDGYDLLPDNTYYLKAGSSGSLLIWKAK